MSASDRLAQLYSQTPDFLFVSFYPSQGNGRGIPTSIHTQELDGWMDDKCIRAMLMNVNFKYTK
jgi:hypothetical protein